MVKSWYRIWYRTTQTIFVLLFISFSIVIPIDCAEQATSSNNNAINTFIVVGAAVALVIFVISISIARILIFRRALQDIPKAYIPVTTRDMPHKDSREYVIKTMKRAGELTEKFKVPKEPVLHAGMEPNESDLFPPNLKYHDVLKFISDRFRFDGALLTTFTNDKDLSITFRKALVSLSEKENKSEWKHLNHLLQLYDKFRFSGEPIERDEFIKFITLYSYICDLSNSLRPLRTDERVSRFLHDKSEYDSNSFSRRGSDMSIGYLRPYPSNGVMPTTTRQSHLGVPSSNINYYFDESDEPSENLEDYQRYHSILTRTDTFDTVIHR